ncbi:hypothetical protein TRSC58_00361 [Trypanosoma rangeli SC58]|uniref:Uncharacterized protein n=1 Tax=Trypanosoma rangeli SC58 TaxID=429131 RepID=A0A061JBY0_TRYRA|nr:hypothetical protein TRSC58_00361 [Trypanosoma rangeli SC58]
MLVADTSPGNTRDGTGCYASPVQQRSPTPRTARTIFPIAEESPGVEQYVVPEKSPSPYNEQLTDGVRRALGLLRDVRSKLIQHTHGRQRRADATANATVPHNTNSPAPVATRSSLRRCRRTQSHTPPDENMTLAEMCMRSGEEKECETVVGIAARRRMEKAPLRPNAERALWRMSVSPISPSIGGKSRSRSRRC